MATTPIDQPNDSTQERTENPISPVAGFLRGVWWASLGLAAVAGEQTGRAVNALIEKGKEIEPTVKERGRKVSENVSEAADNFGEKLKTFATKVGKTAGQAEVAIDERVTAALGRLGVPNRDEVRELREKLDALTARLEELQSKTE